MSGEPIAAVAYVGAIVGLIGGGVALFNSWKAVRWKRAELANSYLKELNTSEELVFACRALDWKVGRLVVPKSLRPLLDGSAEYIEHDEGAFELAMRPTLYQSEMAADVRIQIYRTSLDSFLSWLSLVESAINRDLFKAEDVAEVRYWLQSILSRPAICDFVRVFEYQKSIDGLCRKFSI